MSVSDSGRKVLFLFCSSVEFLPGLSCLHSAGGFSPEDTFSVGLLE